MRQTAEWLVKAVRALQGQQLWIVTGTVDAITGNVATVDRGDAGTIEALCEPSLVSVSDVVAVLVGPGKRGHVLGPAA